MELNATQIEELKALLAFNDATSKPSAIHIGHWDHGVVYRDLCYHGFVRRYARPPKGFSATRFFGAKITEKGRSALHPTTGET